MTWSVDNVDLVICPLSVSSSGTNGDTAFTLEGHEVHNGSALVDVTDLVGFTGEEEHALGNSGLTSVDVGNKADISDLFKVGFLCRCSCHICCHPFRPRVVNTSERFCG